MQPRVTIGIVSFNRPELLTEAIKAIYRNPGEEFDLILWSNSTDPKTKEVEKELSLQYDFTVIWGKENCGQRAIRKLIDMTETEFFIMTEDDMIWFTPGWVKDFVDAMDIIPSPTPVRGTEEEWGILTTNCLQDKVTNGALWPVHFDENELFEKTYDGVKYLVTPFAAGGPILMRTKLAQALDAFTLDCPLFEGEVDMALHRYRKAQYPMAHVKDVYVYHANSPYFNEPYPEVWKVKQGSQTIEEAKKVYSEQDPRFDFSDNPIWDYIKSGTFKDYAEKLWRKSQ